MKGVDIFGESGLLNPTQIWSESALVLSPSAEVWAVARGDFLKSLGETAGVHPALEYLKERCRVRLDGYNMSFEEFEPNKFIARGGFGLVLLTTHRSTGAEYAMKVIPKKGLQEEDIRSISQEKAVMQEMNPPFVIQLVTAFV